VCTNIPAVGIGLFVPGINSTNCSGSTEYGAGAYTYEINFEEPICGLSLMIEDIDQVNQESVSFFCPNPESVDSFVFVNDELVSIENDTAFNYDSETNTYIPIGDNKYFRFNFSCNTSKIIVTLTKNDGGGVGISEFGYNECSECAEDCPDCNLEVPGCTTDCADNYNSEATVDDGSCEITQCTENSDCGECTEDSLECYNFYLLLDASTSMQNETRDEDLVAGLNNFYSSLQSLGINYNVTEIAWASEDSEAITDCVNKATSTNYIAGADAFTNCATIPCNNVNTNCPPGSPTACGQYGSDTDLSDSLFGGNFIGFSGENLIPFCDENCKNILIVMTDGDVSNSAIPLSQTFVPAFDEAYEYYFLLHTVLQI